MTRRKKGSLILKECNNENTFIIGDLHGCSYTLMDLVNKLSKNSRLIFVGDLCDRGLYSKEVIEEV